ncbi:bifunctional riboflavin kinase/FAD synthetase [Microbacterium sp. YY-01]|uniref:bifunctional riboflavin kinase/FAD synthetase n=1 Tax=Microbacterium sp. YY-01 TaxID=3421634 RepID=UPI003D16B1A7
MITLRSPQEVPDNYGPTVIAIGKFDGVHLGHQAVLRHAIERAHDNGMKAVAVTFDRNPLQTLNPAQCPPAIGSLDNKLTLLAEAGVDATLVLTFDQELAALSADDFITRILIDALRAQHIFVGADFRFGHGGKGTPELLRERGTDSGFTVTIVDDVYRDGTERRISSSWIRELINTGDVSQAHQLLGRPYSVDGPVVQGMQRGRELGFPTANLPTIHDLCLPADGVYAGWLIDHADGVRRQAAISIGTNPTFDDVLERQVEAHIIDSEWIDLYGHQVTIEFTQRLRGMVAFEGIEALRITMADDVRRTREILAAGTQQ